MRDSWLHRGWVYAFPVVLLVEAYRAPRYDTQVNQELRKVHGEEQAVIERTAVSQLPSPHPFNVKERARIQCEWGYHGQWRATRINAFSPFSW